jgi:hypothetical protein
MRTPYGFSSPLTDAAATGFTRTGMGDGFTESSSART